VRVKSFAAAVLFCVAAIVPRLQAADKYLIDVSVNLDNSVAQTEMLSDVRRELRSIPDVDVNSQASDKLMLTIVHAGEVYAASVVEIIRDEKDNVSFYVTSWVLTAVNLDQLAKMVRTSFDTDSLEPRRQYSKDHPTQAAPSGYHRKQALGDY